MDFIYYIEREKERERERETERENYQGFRVELLALVELAQSESKTSTCLVFRGRPETVPTPTSGCRIGAGSISNFHLE